MKTSLLLFLNYIIFIKAVEAQLSIVGPGTIQSPASNPVPKPLLSTPASNTPPAIERIGPKCYPETAKAYFLPAPPSSPIVTILDPSSASNCRSNFMDISSNLPKPTSSPTNQVTFLPPPMPVLPDLIDEVSLLVQDRFSRLAESDVKACDTCALVAKLPIYNFDQELLSGFLAGLGL